MMRYLILRAAAVAVLVCALPAAAQSVANGRAIYSNICISCHGFPPSGGPERAEGDPRVIQTAINTRVPAMSFLREVLTTSDVADVAAYLASLSAQPPAPSVPAFDYTDLWWNPAESGWGLNLIQHPSNVIFGVMYTYEPPNRATWFVMPGGTWSSPTTFGGPFYRVTGPAFNGAFDAAAVNVRQVGAATLTFADRDNGTFAFSVDGTPVAKTITRQPF